MKLREEFITHESDGEQILIDTAGIFSGLVRSNATAAFIINLLEKEITEEEIVNIMYEKYEAPKDVIKGDVAEIIAKLRGIGAISE